MNSQNERNDPPVHSQVKPAPSQEFTRAGVQIKRASGGFWRCGESAEDESGYSDADPGL